MWNVIINPNAGNKKATIVGRHVSRFFKIKDIPFAVYFCEREGRTEELAKELSSKGEKDFVLIGGNDTVNEFVNGVEDLSKIAFGMIPAGVGNDFCRALECGKNIDKMMNQIVLKEIQKFDYITCNNRKAVNLISCGLDVSILETYNSYKTKSRLNYLRASFDNIFKYGQIQATVESDEITIKNGAFSMLAFCNGKYYGLGAKINPYCNLKDGIANFFVVEPTTSSQRIKILQKMKYGNHIYLDYVKAYWCKEVTIKSGQPVKMNIDGKVYEMTNPILSVVPDGLNIYMNKNVDL